MALNPNTKEWYEYRLTGIGASDAPAIFGKSEYKTRREVWVEKVEKKINIEVEENTFIQEKGHKTEAWARPFIEMETGFPWKPAMFEHEQFAFIRATLDGWNPYLREVWECKLMGKKIFETLKDESLPTIDRIPPQYYDQLMQQIFVTGAVALRLTGVKEYKDEFDNKQKEIYTFRFVVGEVEKQYIREILVPELIKFWDCVLKQVDPGPSSQDVLEIENQELINLLNEYQEIDKQKKYIEEKSKEIKEKIENHEGKFHCKMKHDGFLLTEMAGRKTISYEKAFNAFVDWIKNLKTNADTQTLCMAIQSFPDEPNLDKYTSIGKPSFKITIPKSKKEIEPIINEPHIAYTVSAQATSDIERVKQELELENKINKWKNPITNKIPRGWASKGKEWQINYCKGQLKKIAKVPESENYIKIKEMINLLK